MLQPKDSYKNYLSLHNEFSEEHRILNKEIIELYVLPKIFIEENESAIRTFVENNSQVDIPGTAELSFRGIRDFLYKVENFKLQTMELFFEHKAYIDSCSEYVKSVAESRQGESSKNYMELIPKVNELRSQLKNLHERAITMAIRLEKIESRWANIRINE
jgi:hypothetical protein